MAVAIVMETPMPDTAAYDAVNQKMDIDNNPPEGLILHSAGRAENGNWRIFDVWESHGHFDRFSQERLGPALSEVMGDQMGSGGPPQQEIYELHKVVNP